MNDDDLLYRGMDEEDPYYMWNDNPKMSNNKIHKSKSSPRGCAGLLLFGFIGIVPIMVLL